MKTSSDYSSETSCWQAVVTRDSTAEGAFVYAVRTTGIYCRPGCASRLPKRDNVQFFQTSLMAEQAGFRPCKRCQPHCEVMPSPAISAIVQACQLIETAEQTPTLPQLAAAVGLSASHFQRLFKKEVGITPQQYIAEKRLAQVRETIQQDETIAETIYNAGFESSSRFYETATERLGMRPSTYRNGGSGVVIRYAVVDSYLGLVLVAATEQGICRIDFDDSAEALTSRLMTTFPKAELITNDPTFADHVAQVVAFLEKPSDGLALPLDIQGTAFQRKVWQALHKIPAGSTRSYGEVAMQIGQPNAARAVAQACAGNPIAVAIPCHRVVRANGDVGGYRWGVARKQAILEREE